MVLMHPFGTLMSLSQALDNTLRTEFSRVPMLERAATPSMNVYQKGDDWTLTFDLPGVRKEDVEIEIHGDRLRVAAERRPLFADDSNVERHRVERSEGRFERVLQLPFTIDSEKVKATTEHGILTVALSPRDSDKPRKVLLS